MYSYLYISVVSDLLSSLLSMLRRLKTEMQLTLATLHDILAIRSLKLKDNYTFDLLQVISFSNVIGLYTQ